jgi:GT2 family glycosyltransferase
VQSSSPERLAGHAKPRPSVSVVVPSWNGKHLLRDVCLPALTEQTYRDFEVIVVDNGSTDGTVAYIVSEWPGIRVVALSRNAGFAGAVNAGIAHAAAALVALVNNDVELDRNWLAELVGAADRFPDAGSLASKILHYHHRAIIATIADCMTAAGDPFWKGSGEEDLGQYDEVSRVFSACAAAALYRREAFARVGVFDEDFFAYLEDVDWGFRAQIQGYECWAIPTAVAYHVGGATSSSVSHVRSALLARNAVWLVVKNLPATLLVRNAHRIAFLNARRFYRLACRQSGTIAIGAFVQCTRGIPRMVRKRQATYRRRRVDDAQLLSLIQSGSLGSEKLDRFRATLTRAVSAPRSRA